MNSEFNSPFWMRRPQREIGPRRDGRVRLELQVPEASTATPDQFPVPVLHVRQAIVRSYVMGIYDSRAIARGLTHELTSRPGGRPVRVDSQWVREVRRRDRSIIESDLAAALASPRPMSTAARCAVASRFGAIYCLHAARERVRLALWVDRLRPSPCTALIPRGKTWKKI